MNQTKRILLKISGESLVGESSFGLDFKFKYKITNVAPSNKNKVINKIVSMIRKLYYNIKLT